MTPSVSTPPLVEVGEELGASSLREDRAVVNGAGQAVSALRASVPSAMPWDDEIAFILGRPGFMFIREAQLFRLLGYDIPTRAEDEQAFFIHRWLDLYFQHGAEWRDRANEDILEHIARGRAAQAIEARRAETGTGSVHESAVGEADAPESQSHD